MKSAPSGFVRQLPEAGHGWIACAPRRWLACDRPWVNLASGRLEPGRVPAGPLPATVDWPRGLDELTYMPPVALAHRPARGDVIASAVERRVPIMVQVLVGEEAPPDAALAVVDLTGLLLAGENRRLAEVPAGSHAIWPLVSGITDRREDIEAGVSVLAEVGVRTVRGVEVEIDPVLRQRLAQGRPAEVFDALFRRPATSEAAFATLAAAHGLGLWPDRPTTGKAPRTAGNRRIAGALAEAAELWQRLDRSESAAQALWRAFRGAESSEHDLEALGREGNLAVLDWLDERSLGVARAAAMGNEPALLRELRAAYVGAS